MFWKELLKPVTFANCLFIIYTELQKDGGTEGHFCPSNSYRRNNDSSKYYTDFAFC